MAPSVISLLTPPTRELYRPSGRDYPLGYRGLIKDDATTLTGTQGNLLILIMKNTLTGYYVVSSFVSHIPAMSQNLCSIAFPFAVLGVASLLSVDFAGGNQVFQLLYAAYDFCGRIFAECLSLHDTKDILQHDFGGVDRSYKTSCHRLCGSGNKDTPVVNVLFGFPLAPLHCLGNKGGAGRGAD